jgi:uncharacterized protein (DUF362 family)
MQQVSRVKIGGDSDSGSAFMEAPLQAVPENKSQTLPRTLSQAVPETLPQAVLRAVNEIGGFIKIITPGDKVLLKPNFNTADEFPGSSDPEFLKAVIGLVYEAGAGEIILGESSTFMLNPKKVMEKKGIFDLMEIFPKLKIVNFNEGKWIKKEIPEARFLKTASIPELLSQVNKIIYLPCLKTHSMGQFTGSIKLSVGMMKPGERLSLHMGHLQEKFAELSTLVKPDLIIMDGRKCFITGGPGKGEFREPGIILASTGRVAIDIEGIKIIQSFEGNSLSGILPEDLPQIKRAIELGLT